jgi:hypothetical protein
MRISEIGSMSRPDLTFSCFCFTPGILCAKNRNCFSPWNQIDQHAMLAHQGQSLSRDRTLRSWPVSCFPSKAFWFGSGRLLSD